MTDHTEVPEPFPFRVGDVVALVRPWRGQTEGVITEIPPPKDRRQRRIFLTVEVEVDGKTMRLHYETKEVHRPGEPAVEWEWDRL